MPLDITQVDLTGPFNFNEDGYNLAVLRPTYDALVDDALQKHEDPWGPSGNEMAIAVLAGDQKTIYREVKVFGMGGWMGMVNSLLDAGFVDLLAEKQHPRFDALFCPPDTLLANMPSESEQAGSKYDPLISHLNAFTGAVLTLSFEEIDALLGKPLPPTAKAHPQWWANTTDDPTHTWANRWTAAGWKAQPDLPGQRVTFTRTGGESASDQRLKDLVPTSLEPVMDLVQRAGVDVSDWHFTSEGTEVANPRANPNFCYDWSFGSPTAGYVLCLWHGDLGVDGSLIVSNNDVGSHRQRLEQLRDEPGADAPRRSRLNQQLRRARSFEEALEFSWRQGRALRVIINAGRQRLGEEIAERASRVELRALDPEPWYVHAHDESAGRWLLVRGVPFGTDDGDAGLPPDDDHSPGADDSRRFGTIKVRRGQADFRAALISAYDAKCAVTGSRITDLLEAAHILPHAERTNYRVSNGLLLRADIHTLYDLHLLSIDERCRIHLSKRLAMSEYRRYHGTELLVLPSAINHQPSAESLRVRHERFLTAERTR